MASINGMQVKEYIQSLVDENKLRIEKIGSGNWYWSFASDEVKERERELGVLRTEVEKVRGVCEEVEGRVAVLRTKRKTEGEEGEGLEEERNGLMRVKGELEREVGMLRRRTEEMRRGQGRRSVAAMKPEIGELKQQTQMWTDNVYVLEEYVRKLAAGDLSVVQALQQEVYGEEYAEGEGLRECEC